MSTVSLNVTGELELNEQLELVKLPGAKRRQFHRKLNRLVTKKSRERIRNQKDLQGQPFTPRKGKSRRRMLTRLMRAKNLRQIANDQKGVVTWGNSLMGQIARRHQEGIPEIMTADRMEKIHGQPDYKGPATRQQAVALREQGYTIAGKGKRRKKPTLKWIQENMTLGQAGIILRMMRNKEQKRSWEITIPARQFLGLEKHEITQASREILQDMTQR